MSNVSKKIEKLDDMSKDGIIKMSVYTNKLGLKASLTLRETSFSDGDEDINTYKPYLAAFRRLMTLLDFEQFDYFTDEQFFKAVLLLSSGDEGLIKVINEH